MLKLLRTKEGLLTVAAWFAIWLMLEMVFFGEPMFCYSASTLGYAFYLVEISLVAVVSLVLGAFPRAMRWVSGLLARPAYTAAASVLGSASLFVIRLAVDPAFPLPAEPVLAVAVACFVATSVPLACLWADRTMGLVFEQGLRQVLILMLLGIALSFLLVPRFLRDTLYGIAVVGLTPALMGMSLLAMGRRGAPDADAQLTDAHPTDARLADGQRSNAPVESGEPGESVEPASEVDTPTQALSRRCILLSLGGLATFSFLVYLISYFDFVVPAGFKVVVDENPYYYLAIFILIGILVATLALVGSERVLTSRVFLYILFGLMVLSLLVFFGVLSYTVEGGDYMYALTKLLRRIVKIAMLYVLVIVTYQNSLAAGRTFALVLVAPLVLAKLVQMAVVTIPGLQAFVDGHQFLYFSGIGFASIITWSLILVASVQGNTLFYTVAEAAGPVAGAAGGELGARLAGGAEGERGGSDAGGWRAGRDGDAVAGSEVAMGDAQPQDSADALRKTALAEATERYGLTEREADVLAYLAAGYSLRAISGALCVSQNTVKTHVSGVYRKTGLHSRQEVIELMASWRG